MIGVPEVAGANPGEAVYLVYTTVGSAEEGARLGRQVVSERLAACANLIPKIRSFYWWDGQLVDDAESFLVLKTTDQGLQPLIARLKELHSYDVPAINAIRLDAGHPDYWQWVAQETRPVGPGDVHESSSSMQNEAGRAEGDLQ